VSRVRQRSDIRARHPLPQNDAGVAVANSLAAVRAGATQVQGCVNGYGERAGNTEPDLGDPRPVPQTQHPHHPRRPHGSG